MASLILSCLNNIKDLLALDQQQDQQHKQQSDSKKNDASNESAKSKGMHARQVELLNELCTLKRILDLPLQQAAPQQQQQQQQQQQSQEQISYADLKKIQPEIEKYLKDIIIGPFANAGYVTDTHVNVTCSLFEILFKKGDQRNLLGIANDFQTLSLSKTLHVQSRIGALRGLEALYKANGRFLAGHIKESLQIITKLTAMKASMGNGLDIHYQKMMAASIDAVSAGIYNAASAALNIHTEVMKIVIKAINDHPKIDMVIESCLGLLRSLALSTNRFSTIPADQFILPSMKLLDDESLSVRLLAAEVLGVVLAESCIGTSERAIAQQEKSDNNKGDPEPAPAVPAQSTASKSFSALSFSGFSTSMKFKSSSSSASPATSTPSASSTTQNSASGKAQIPGHTMATALHTLSSVFHKANVTWNFQVAVAHATLCFFHHLPLPKSSSEIFEAISSTFDFCSKSSQSIDQIPTEIEQRIISLVVKIIHQGIVSRLAENLQVDVLVWLLDICNSTKSNTVSIHSEDGKIFSYHDSWTHPPYHICCALIESQSLFGILGETSATLARQNALKGLSKIISHPSTCVRVEASALIRNVVLCIPSLVPELSKLCLEEAQMLIDILSTITTTSSSKKNTNENKPVNDIFKQMNASRSQFVLPTDKAKSIHGNAQTTQFLQDILETRVDCIGSVILTLRVGDVLHNYGIPKNIIESSFLLALELISGSSSDSSRSIIDSSKNSCNNSGWVMIGYLVSLLNESTVDSLPWFIDFMPQLFALWHQSISHPNMISGSSSNANEKSEDAHVLSENLFNIVGSFCTFVRYQSKSFQNSPNIEHACMFILNETVRTVLSASNKISINAGRIHTLVMETVNSLSKSSFSKFDSDSHSELLDLAFSIAFGCEKADVADNAASFILLKKWHNFENGNENDKQYGLLEDSDDILSLPHCFPSKSRGLQNLLQYLSPASSHHHAASQEIRSELKQRSRACQFDMYSLYDKVSQPDPNKVNKYSSKDSSQSQIRSKEEFHTLSIADTVASRTRNIICDPLCVQQSTKRATKLLITALELIIRAFDIADESMKDAMITKLIVATTSAQVSKAAPPTVAPTTPNDSKHVPIIISVVISFGYMKSLYSSTPSVNPSKTSTLGDIVSKSTFKLVDTYYLGLANPSSSTVIRRACAQGLGYICYFQDPDSIEKVLKTLTGMLIPVTARSAESNSAASKIPVSANSTVTENTHKAVGGACFALACIRKTSKIKSPHYLQIFEVCKLATSTTLRVWGIYSWLIVIEAIGQEVSGFVKSCLAIITTQILSTAKGNSTQEEKNSVMLTVAKLLHVLILAIGNDIINNKDWCDSVLSTWNILSMVPFELVQLECISILSDLISLMPTRLLQSSLPWRFYILGFIKNHLTVNGTLYSFKVDVSDATRFSIVQLLLQFVQYDAYLFSNEFHWGLLFAVNEEHCRSNPNIFYHPCTATNCDGLVNLPQYEQYQTQVLLSREEFDDAEKVSSFSITYSDISLLVHKVVHTALHKSLLSKEASSNIIETNKRIVSLYFYFRSIAMGVDISHLSKASKKSAKASNENDDGDTDEINKDSRSATSKSSNKIADSSANPSLMSYLDDVSLQLNDPKEVEILQAILSSPSIHWQNRSLGLHFLQDIVSLAPKISKSHVDLSLARQKRKIGKESDSGYNYLVSYLESLITCACQISATFAGEYDAGIFQLCGILLLRKIVSTFSVSEDPDVKGQPLLQQYEAQINATLRNSFSWKGSRYLIKIAGEISSITFIHSITSLTSMKRILTCIWPEGNAKYQSSVNVLLNGESVLIASDNAKHDESTKSKQNEKENDDDDIGSEDEDGNSNDKLSRNIERSSDIEGSLIIHRATTIAYLYLQLHQEREKEKKPSNALVNKIKAIDSILSEDMLDVWVWTQKRILVYFSSLFIDRTKSGYYNDSFEYSMLAKSSLIRMFCYPSMIYSSAFQSWNTCSEVITTLLSINHKSFTSRKSYHHDYNVLVNSAIYNLKVQTNEKDEATTILSRTVFTSCGITIKNTLDCLESALSINITEEKAQDSQEELGICIDLVTTIKLTLRYFQSRGMSESLNQLINIFLNGFLKNENGLINCLTSVNQQENVDIGANRDIDACWDGIIEIVASALFYSVERKKICEILNIAYSESDNLAPIKAGSLHLVVPMIDQIQQLCPDEFRNKYLTKLLHLLSLAIASVPAGTSNSGIVNEDGDDFAKYLDIARDCFVSLTNLASQQQSEFVNEVLHNLTIYSIKNSSAQVFYCLMALGPQYADIHGQCILHWEKMIKDVNASSKINLEILDIYISNTESQMHKVYMPRIALALFETSTSQRDTTEQILMVKCLVSIAGSYSSFLLPALIELFLTWSSNNDAQLGKLSRKGLLLCASKSQEQFKKYIVALDPSKRSELESSIRRGLSEQTG